MSDVQTPPEENPAPATTTEEVAPAPAETPVSPPWQQGQALVQTAEAPAVESVVETPAVEPVAEAPVVEQASTTSGEVTNPGTPPTVTETQDAVQAQLDGTVPPTPNVIPGEVAAPGFTPDQVVDPNVALQPPAVVPVPNTEDVAPTVAPVATVISPVTPAGTSVVPPTTVDATTVPPTPVSPVQGVEPVSPKSPVIIGTTVIDDPVGSEAHIYANNAIKNDEGAQAVNQAAEDAAQEARDSVPEVDDGPVTHESILAELLADLEGMMNMAKAEIQAVISRARAKHSKL